MRYPSGGLLLLDAGLLLNASVSDLAALQRRLRHVARRRACRPDAVGAHVERCGQGSVLFVPVPGGDHPRSLQEVRLGDRPTRLIVDLEGRPSAGVPALPHPPAPDPAQAHDEATSGQSPGPCVLSTAGGRG